MKHVSLMIGERDIGAADGRTFDRLDPFTGQVASRSAAASVADAIAAADAANAITTPVKRARRSKPRPAA